MKQTSVRRSAARVPELYAEQGLEIVALLVIFILGLFAIGIAPLVDPSEARYATIAQRMVISGNWLVPEINRGQGFIPFWGKPPLHIWAVALSMKVFGFSEFAARLPSLLSLCGVAWLCMLFAKRCLSKEAARIAPFLIVTSPLLMVFGLSCVTDTSLTLWLTLALVSFALQVESQQSESRRWGYAFFLALAAGFLTKGPLIIALVGFVVSGWLLISKRWSALRSFPWLGGISLMLLVAMPWFVLAERASPGFLQYFFVNENYMRFVSSHYVDLYGTSHRTFRGVILPYMLLATLPWGPLLAIAAFRKKKMQIVLGDNPWSSFLLLWIAAPVVLFLPSNNVLLTYCLPGIPGAVLLLSRCLVQWRDAVESCVKSAYSSLLGVIVITGLCVFVAEGVNYLPNLFVWAGCMTLVISYASFKGSVNRHALALAFCCVLTGLFAFGEISKSWSDQISTRQLIQSLDLDDKTEQVAFLGKLPYSALFYLQADSTSREFFPMSVRKGLKPPADLIVKRSEIDSLPIEQRALLEPQSGTGMWAIIDTDEDEVKPLSTMTLHQ